MISPAATPQLKPPREISAPVLDALKHQAKLPAALSAKALAQFIIKGKTQPRVRAMINWVRTDDGLKFRATGLGVMGVTVFDCLISDGWFYLYIPSHGVIYTANFNDDTLSDGLGLSRLADEAILVLAPWSAYEIDGRDILECGDSYREKGLGHSLCIAFAENGQRGLVGLDPKTLAPLYLRLKDINVRYGASNGLSDGSPYPNGFHLEIPGLKLQIDISLKEVLSARPDDSIFDPMPFCQGRIAPLSILLDRIKDGGASM
ncbi:MAG: hypothetical protein ACUVQ2_08655 [Dissulfurimicrobium sp.]|uniref:hypothetical protein n=1 Tax=Dissulfurimicrobium sp. TaxID=2022436 RepID=UPI00404B1839